MPKMGEKEMWVYLLAYNLIHLIMAQSALMADVLPRTLSFKHTLQLWLAWSGTHNQQVMAKTISPDYWLWWLSSPLAIGPDELSREP